jgi:hypothetical protein
MWYMGDGTKVWGSFDVSFLTTYNDGTYIFLCMRHISYTLITNNESSDVAEF